MVIFVAYCSFCWGNFLWGGLFVEQTFWLSSRYFGLSSVEGLSSTVCFSIQMSAGDISNHGRGWKIFAAQPCLQLFIPPNLGVFLLVSKFDCWWKLVVWRGFNQGGRGVWGCSFPGHCCSLRPGVSHPPNTAHSSTAEPTNQCVVPLRPGGLESDFGWISLPTCRDGGTLAAPTTPSSPFHPPLLFRMVTTLHKQFQTKLLHIKINFNEIKTNLAEEMAGHLFLSQTACFPLDGWRRHRWESCKWGNPQVMSRWTIGKRRQKFLTALWAQLSMTPGYGHPASMAQVLFLHKP